jgi:hypothetical protein
MWFLFDHVRERFNGSSLVLEGAQHWLLRSDLYKILGGLALRVYSIASVLGVLYWRSISLRATMFPVV